MAWDMIDGAHDIGKWKDVILANGSGDGQMVGGKDDVSRVRREGQVSEDGDRDEGLEMSSRLIAS